MDTERWQILLKAIDRGSLRAAAEEMGFTVSGISRSVATLEKELGFALLYRAKSGVQPTAECRQLLPSVRELLFAQERLEQTAAKVRGADCGTIVIGTAYNCYYEWVTRMMAAFRTRHPGVVIKIVNEELVALMGGSEAARLNIKNKGQTIIMLCGLQGNGKTTHAAKLAKYYIKQGRRPMLVACDIYRPAAIDQLQVVGKQAGAPVFTLPGEKPPAIAKKALAHAKDYGNDIIILDTAGRLQIDEVLMQELVQIKEAVPVDETLLVVDAMAGQDAVNVAKTFNETVGIDGIILTKTDGDTRGGAALSVLSVTGKPIKFQGTGEKLDDLEVFHPSRMAGRILGMGDVLSLIERAQDAADEKLAEETAKRMMENKFDMNDMLAQFAQIRKMGGAGAMLSMMPGMSGIDASQIDEKAFDRIEAMIYSMTKAEREDPSIINPKRKRRIAAGSGTQVSDVNKLLKQFEMMQKMMKQLKKSPKGFARKLGGLMGNPGAFRGMK